MEVGKGYIMVNEPTNCPDRSEADVVQASGDSDENCAMLELDDGDVEVDSAQVADVPELISELETELVPELKLVVVLVLVLVLVDADLIRLVSDVASDEDNIVLFADDVPLGVAEDATIVDGEFSELDVLEADHRLVDPLLHQATEDVGLVGGLLCGEEESRVSDLSAVEESAFEVGVADVDVVDDRDVILVDRVVAIVLLWEAVVRISDELLDT
ncbi:hypothetical protein GGI07_004125 [Coemansia sp. Benny D115]|nr:hypothetical protein GGI07_004125 [Coemansia sp. Benny D115]